MSRSASRLTGQNVSGLTLPLYDFDLRASHARTLLPAALASVSFGFVLVRVVRAEVYIFFSSKLEQPFWFLKGPTALLKGKRSGN